jgi:hypothetical protein
VRRHSWKPLDETQIEDVFEFGGARSRPHRQVIVVDDSKLQSAAAKAAADLEVRVDAACGTRVRHLPDLRLEHDVFSRPHEAQA